MKVFIERLIKLGQPRREEGLQKAETLIQSARTGIEAFDEMMRFGSLSLDPFRLVLINGVSFAHMTITAAQGDLQKLATLLRYRKYITKVESDKYSRLVDTVYSDLYKMEMKVAAAAKLRPDLNLPPGAEFNPRAEMDIALVNRRIKAKLETIKMFGLNVDVKSVPDNVGILEHVTQLRKGLWVHRRGDVSLKIPNQACFDHPAPKYDGEYPYAVNWYNTAAMVSNFMLKDDEHRKNFMTGMKIENLDFMDWMPKNYVYEFNSINKYLAKNMTKQSNQDTLQPTPVASRCQLSDPRQFNVPNNGCVIWNPLAQPTSIEYLSLSHLPPNITTECVKNPTVLSTIVALGEEYGDEFTDDVLPKETFRYSIKWALGIGLVFVLLCIILILALFKHSLESMYPIYI